MKLWKAIVFSSLLPMLLLWAGCGEDKPLSTLFPEQVGEMRLAQVITGEEAMRAVAQLHGKTLDVDDAAVATYALPDQGEAVVWVSSHANAAQAREQSAVMIEKMLHPLGGAETPFHDPEQFRTGGSDIYSFQGMGVTHLVFYRENRVYWIAAPGEAPEGGGLSPSGLLLQAMLADNPGE